MRNNFEDKKRPAGQAASRGAGYGSQRGAGPRTGGKTSVPPATRIGGTAPRGDDAPRAYADGVRPDRAPRRQDKKYDRAPRQDFAYAKPAPAKYAPPKARPVYKNDDAPDAAMDIIADVSGEERALTPEERGILVGRNPIREALRAGQPVEKLLVANGDLSGAAMDIIRMAKDNGTVVQMVDRTRLDQIYPAHQGMLAYVAQVPFSSVEEILARAKEAEQDPFVVILDGITDPHNLGAIIRSAECMGAHGVIIPQRRSAGLNMACAKSAAGALAYMPVARVTNLNRTIDELKEAGLWVTAAALDGEDAAKCDLTGPIALVIGSEGDGISRLTLEKCDRRVTLHMTGHLDSLNASVAAGILMYEIACARAGK